MTDWAWLLFCLFRPTRKDECVEGRGSTRNGSVRGGGSMVGAALGGDRGRSGDWCTSFFGLVSSVAPSSSRIFANNFFMPPAPAYGLDSLTTSSFCFLDLRLFPRRPFSSCSRIRTMGGCLRCLNISGIPEEPRSRVGKRGVL